MLKKHCFYALLAIGSFSIAFAAEKKSDKIVQYRDENGKDVIHKNNLIRAEGEKDIVYVKTCNDKVIHVVFNKKRKKYSMTTNYFDPYYWKDEKKKAVAKETFEDIQKEFNK